MKESRAFGFLVPIGRVSFEVYPGLMMALSRRRFEGSPVVHFAFIGYAFVFRFSRPEGPFAFPFSVGMQFLSSAMLFFFVRFRRCSRLDVMKHAN